MKKAFVIVLFLLAFSFTSFAQTEDTTKIHPDMLSWDRATLENKSIPKVIRFLEIGVSANAYKGELGNFNQWASSFHIGLKWNKKTTVNGRVGLSIGKVIGDNPLYAPTIKKQEIRVNTFFNAKIVSLHYELQINFISHPRYKIYLSQGIGLFRFVSQNENKAKLIDINSSRLNTENYNIVSVMLPTGLGASYMFKNGYAFGFQASILNHFTDYLDNISVLGNSENNDNTAMFRFHLSIPLKKNGILYLPKMYKINSSRDILTIFE